MHQLKLASSILLITLLSACSSTRTASTLPEDNFNPNLLPATAGGTKAPNGYIRYWEYTNLEGTDLSSLYNSADYPLLYSRSARLTSMQKEAKITNGAIRMAGYLFPSVSGQYSFKIESNSNAELWLSSDAKAFKKKKIILLNSNGANTNSPGMVQSATSSRSVYLEAGKYYFLEAVAKINNSGEVLNVFWSYPMPSVTGVDMASKMEIIPGSVILNYARNKVESPSQDYLDGMQDGYSRGYSDAALGLNYNNNYPITDSDHDGLPDRWEESYGLDPLNYNDASLDIDGDGLSNHLEFQERTEPYIADTDNDGIPDGWEVSNDLNPNNASDALLIDASSNLTFLALWQIEAGVSAPGDSTSAPGDSVEAITPNTLYLQWQAPTQRVNGDEFTTADIQHYVIHYKLETETTFNQIVIADGNATEYNIEELPSGTYLVGMSVVDSSGMESTMSELETRIVE